MAYRKRSRPVIRGHGASSAVISQSGKSKSDSSAAEGLADLTASKNGRLFLLWARRGLMSFWRIVFAGADFGVARG